jgi:hypothetical protein
MQLQLATTAIQMFMPPPQGAERFDFGVRTRISAVDMKTQFAPSQLDVDTLVQNWLPAKRWVLANHHWSHALLGYFESDFVPSLVVSYDGGGNDGHFLCWEAKLESPSSLRWSPVSLSDTKLPNLGDRYAAIGQRNIPEVRSAEILAVAGKLMALAALGTPKADIVSVLREWMHYNNSVPLPEQTVSSYEEQIDSHRDVAASTQKAFEELAFELIATALARVSFAVEAIVLTGGCALNVIVNDLAAQRFGLPVHVPASPNDGTHADYPRARLRSYRIVPVSTALLPTAAAVFWQEPTAITILECRWLGTRRCIRGAGTTPNFVDSPRAWLPFHRARAVGPGRPFRIVNEVRLQPGCDHATGACSQTYDGAADHRCDSRSAGGGTSGSWSPVVAA